MTLSEKQMEQILGKELQIPDKVNERIHETYGILRSSEKKQGKHSLRRRHSYTAAAIAVICCLAIPGGVYAAANSDFFDGIFGNKTKKSTPAVTKEVDNQKGGTTSVTFPSHEYVSVDPDEAEKILGGGALNKPVEKKLGEHTLRIENMIYDKHSAFMYFTLERKGGVTLLIGNEETNAAKGAYFDENDRWSFHPETTEGNTYGENIYIDTEKSTEDKLYCYAYMIPLETLKEDEFPVLKIFNSPVPFKEFTEELKLKEEIVPLTEKEPVPVETVDLGENQSIEYSPISMTFHLTNKIGLTEADAADPVNLRHVEIRYQDGTSYVICDTKENVENNSYWLTTDATTTVTYNRLVNTEEIKEIIINDTTFSVE